MIDALDLIREKATTEGFNFPREKLLQFAFTRIALKEDILMQYGNVLFIVSTDPALPVMHLYAKDANYTLLSAMRNFSRDVWTRVSHTYILAPILNETVIKLANKMGGSIVKKLSTGHVLYKFERPLNEPNN